MREREKGKEGNCKCDVLQSIGRCRGGGRERHNKEDVEGGGGGGGDGEGGVMRKGW